MSEPLRIERRDGVWTFVLQRPDKRNALSAGPVERLLDGVAEAHAQHARVLVFRARAGTSCRLRLRRSRPAQRRRPAAALRSHRDAAAGRGIVAVPDGRAGARQELRRRRRPVRRMPPTHRQRGRQLPHAGLKFGLVLGTRRFGQIVGAERAARIQQHAASFDAAQAVEMGFVHELQEPDRWDAAIAEALSVATTLDDWSRGRCTARSRRRSMTPTWLRWFAPRHDRTCGSASGTTSVHPDRREVAPDSSPPAHRLRRANWLARAWRPGRAGPSRDDQVLPGAAARHLRPRCAGPRRQRRGRTRCSCSVTGKWCATRRRPPAARAASSCSPNAPASSPRRTPAAPSC